MLKEIFFKICKILWVYSYKLLRKGSWQNLLTLNSLLKLAFLYLITVLHIILFNFKFYPNLTSFIKPHPYRISLYGVEGRIGENVLHNEIIKTINKKNWQVISTTFPESLTTFFLTKHFYIAASSLVNSIFNPEFNLSTTHYTSIVPYGFNLIYLNVPLSMLIDTNYEFQKPFNFLYNFDGYVDLNSFVKNSDKQLKEILLKKNFNNKLIIPAYLTKGQVVTPKNHINLIQKEVALITGSLWGCNRNALRFKLTLKKLSDEGYLEAIGFSEDFNFLKNNYKGFIPAYKTNEIEAFMRNYRIGLIIHNLEHLIEAIPTNRIIEVITSNSIAISDKHSFIEKIFKDNVLYYDSLASEEVIFQQIKQHIDWIRSHPYEANVKVKNTIDIFNSNLALEQTLERIFTEVQDYKKANNR